MRFAQTYRCEVKLRYRWRSRVVAGLSIFGPAILGLGLDLGCSEPKHRDQLPQTCAAAERLDFTTADRQRKALRALFLAADKPHAEDSFALVDARLAAHINDWRERAQRLACSPDPAIRECLATRAQILRATLETLLDLDAETLEFAIDAAAALEPASTCIRSSGALDGQITPALDELRLQVARARALARSGQVWAALEAARDASSATDRAISEALAKTHADAYRDPPPTAQNDRKTNPKTNPKTNQITNPKDAVLDVSRDRLAISVDANTLLAGLLADTGDADGALEILKRAHRHATSLRDPYRLLSIQTARAQIIGLRQGQIAEALALCEHARTDALALGDAAAPELAILHETRGLLLEANDDSKAAETAFKSALEIHRRARADGLRAPAASAVMNHLGTMLIQDGHYDRACELLKRTLDRYREDYGPAHPVLALPLQNLGLAYQRQGRYALALASLEEAVALQEQTLGVEHPRLASTLDNLGLVARKLGDFDRARECSERAIELYSQSLGPDHLRLVAPLRNLGNIARERGDHRQALDYLTQALAIQERESNDARALAHVLHDLANVYGRLGDLDQAESHFTRALTLLENALGKTHPDLKGPLIGLGNVDRDRGALGRAESRYQRALTLMRDHFGDEHPEVAVALFNLGNIQKDLGHLDIAEHHYRQALAIREAALREDHPLVIKNLTTLGKTLIASGQPIEAMQLLERALDLSLTKTSQSTPEEIAALRFLFARVLWDGVPAPDVERARSLAESAAVFYAAAGIDYARQARTIDRWLAHRAP